MIGKTLLLVCLAGYVSAQEAVYEDPSAAAGGSAAGAGYYGGAAQDPYLQNRDGGFGQQQQQPQFYSPPQDPLIPNLYPTAILGGLGALGMAYFKNAIDQSYNKSLYAFEALHHTVDHRLEHLEESINDDGKENKKLDFKTKVLCKFANLFNNPTYEICNQGFDGGQVVGPTGGPSDHLVEEIDTTSASTAAPDGDYNTDGTDDTGDEADDNTGTGSATGDESGSATAGSGDDTNSAPNRFFKK